MAPAQRKLRRRAGLVLLAMAAAVMALGPRARVGPVPAVPEPGPDVERYLRASEDTISGLRPGDEKRIVWARPEARARTRNVIVYLHGFSADSHEVEPLVSRLAQSFGANVYFARLAGHGRGSEAMGRVDAVDWLRDVQEAVAIGRHLGDEVVLVGTSTGGTLATWAALQSNLGADLAALVLLSPNFHPADHTARLLLWPWGGLIARLVVGPERCFEPVNERHARHWTECYPSRALLPMMALVEEVRTSDLARVRVPTLVVYSPEDRIVDPSETERVFGRIGAGLKELVPLSGLGGPDRHVPAGEILSPGTTDVVLELVQGFMGRALTGP